MAALRGLCPNFAACWGCLDVGRAATPGTANLVLQPAPLVEGFEMSRRNTPKGETPTPSTASGVSGEQLSFLPPPPFCPSWPTKNTLADRALGMLMDGRMIDHPDFENSTQSWRLGAVIFTLRTLGWPIETIEIPSPTEHSPDRVIALYHLPAKYTAKALAMNGRAA